MATTPKLTCHFEAKIFLLLLSSSLWFNLADATIVKAQDTSSLDELSSESTVVQNTSELTNKEEAAQEAARRMRPTFFEQERQPRFGFGDFLNSALDGNQNAFPDPAKVSGFRSNPLSDTLLVDVEGLLTVESRDDDTANFLDTDFDVSGVGASGSVTLTDADPSSDPHLGNLTVSVDLTLDDGQTIELTGVPANFNAGFSSRDDNVTGVLLITDPNNPRQSILIQLPVTNIEGFAELDDDEPITAPARLSIGLPTDR